MLRTGRCSLSIGSSIVSPTATLPPMTVPVNTVPWPLIAKQWSMENKNGPCSKASEISDRNYSSPTRALWPGRRIGIR